MLELGCLLDTPEEMDSEFEAYENTLLGQTRIKSDHIKAREQARYPWRVLYTSKKGHWSRNL
jgi:hypothetical protein